MIWEIDDDEPRIEGLDADGRPDPAYAAALGLLRAPFGRRALALTVDVALWLCVVQLLWLGPLPLLIRFATGSISLYGLVNHPTFVLAVVMAAVSMFLGLVLLVVQLVLHGRKGMTIGKAATGIRTVGVARLERPGVGAVLVRLLLVGVSGIVPLLGPALILSSPTFDPDGRGRGLHDKAARVWLVDVRKGLNPYDQKRMRIARKMAKVTPTAEKHSLPSLATPTDPAAQPQYRPGSRVSAGVLGVSRAHDVVEPSRSAQSAAQAKPPAAPAQPPADQSQPPRAVPAAPPATAAAFCLRFDSGEIFTITGPTLFGRNPDAAGSREVRVIALADDSRSLSKTHLMARPVDGGLEIVDRHSTNGSGIIRDGAEHPLIGDAPVVVGEGDQVRLGERTASVVRA
ncbi:RDD family protein [Microbacterium koreense]|uniref:RDD family protein n=1 Tax=Microbacterium koreense TaxID=323761 RepID=A0ABW2ZQ85_9MICO